MSDYTTYLADNPNSTSKNAFVDGSKFHVMTDENGKVSSLFDWEGSKFGDYTYESGAFSGTSSENISNYLNNKSVWTNSVGLTNDTVKNETQEKSQKDSSTKYTVVGVKNKREGTLWSENAFSSKSRTLVYPADHAPDQFDFIKVTPIEYVPALGADDFKKKNTTITTSTINANTGTTTYSTSLNKNVVVSSGEWFGFESIKSRYQRVKRVGSTMFLPMVPDISESNAVDWGEDRMNALQAAGGALAFNAIGTAGGGEPVKAVSDLIGQGGQVAKAFVNTPGMGDFVKAHFAGKAVNANLL